MFSWIYSPVEAVGSSLLLQTGVPALLYFIDNGKEPFQAI
jgi:hypothetical protein